MFVQHVKDAVRKAPKEEETGDQDKGGKEIRAVQSAHEFQRFVFHFFLLIFIFEAFSGGVAVQVLFSFSAHAGFT